MNFTSVLCRFCHKHKNWGKNTVRCLQQIEKNGCRKSNGELQQIVFILVMLWLKLLQLLHYESYVGLCDQLKIILFEKKIEKHSSVFCAVVKVKKLKRSVFLLSIFEEMLESE